MTTALLGLSASGVVALNRVTAKGVITNVVVGRGGTSLVSINDHAHFERDARRLLMSVLRSEWSG